MFLVECSELNEKLVVMCEDLIKKILAKVEYLITSEQATSVTGSVRMMT